MNRTVSSDGCAWMGATYARTAVALLKNLLYYIELLFGDDLATPHTWPLLFSDWGARAAFDPVVRAFWRNGIRSSFFWRGNRVGFVLKI